MFRIIYLTLVFLVVLPAAGHAKLNVVTTLPDLGAIARSIGGEKIEVTVLAHPAEDPHFVDPKPSFLVKLRQADVLIINGMDLESSWLYGLISNARNGKILRGSAGFIDASSVVKRREVGGTDRAQGDIHPAGNPHYLYDPREALAVSALIGKRLAQLDPANGELFIGRTKQFRKDLFLFAKQERNRFAQLPIPQRRVVSYHRSMAYFADWLGLHIIAEFEPKPGIPPTPAHLGRVIAAMKERNVKAILKEGYFSSKTVQNVAQKIGADIIIMRGSDGQDYIQNLRGLVNRLYDVIN